MSLLRRLASVGLGRRDDDDPIGAGPPADKQLASSRESARREPRKEPVAPQSEYAKRPPQPRVNQQGGLYKPRQGDLDPHGRQVQREARNADDELEIPAFLRRQAN